MRRVARAGCAPTRSPRRRPACLRPRYLWAGPSEDTPRRRGGGCRSGHRAGDRRAGGTLLPMPPTRFPLRLGARSRPLFRLWGATPATAYVDLDGDLEARFGRFSVRTPIANVARWRIEGPWRWITAIGIRRSFRGGDITFGGNSTG